MAGIRVELSRAETMPQLLGRPGSSEISDANAPNPLSIMQLAMGLDASGSGPLSSAIVPRWKAAGGARRMLPGRVDNSALTTQTPVHVNVIGQGPVVNGNRLDVAQMHELAIIRKSNADQERNTAGQQRRKRMQTIHQYYLNQNVILAEPDTLDEFTPASWNAAQRAETHADILQILETNAKKKGSVKEAVQAVLEYYDREFPLKVWDDYAIAGVVKLSHTMGQTTTGINGGYSVSAVPASLWSPDLAPAHIQTLVRAGMVEIVPYDLNRGCAFGARKHLVIKRHQMAFPVTLELASATGTLGQMRLQDTELQLRDADMETLAKAIPYAPLQMSMETDPLGGRLSARYKEYHLRYELEGAPNTNVLHYYDGVIQPFATVQFDSLHTLKGVPNHQKWMKPRAPLALEPLTNTAALYQQVGGERQTVLLDIELPC